MKLNANVFRALAVVGLVIAAFAYVALEQPWKARVGYFGVVVAMLGSVLRLIASVAEARAMLEKRKQGKKD